MILFLNLLLPHLSSWSKWGLDSLQTDTASELQEALVTIKALQESRSNSGNSPQPPGTQKNTHFRIIYNINMIYLIRIFWVGWQKSGEDEADLRSRGLVWFQYHWLKKLAEEKQFDQTRPTYYAQKPSCWFIFNFILNIWPVEKIK